MILVNRSRYPDAELRALAKIATHGIKMDDVEVHFGNNRQAAYVGRAYQSAAAGKCSPRARYLITVRLGAPEKFPADNIVTSERWSDLEPGERQEDWPKTRMFYLAEGAITRVQAKKPFIHGYGGLRSPVIHMNDWREGFVALLAHEARHIHQYRHGKPASEVDAERWAAKRLEAYRATYNQG